MWKLFTATGLTMTLLLPMRVEAEFAFELTEVSMLPAYCKHTLLFREKVPGGANPAAIERLFTVMGPTFIHMHHYCYGLVATNRANLITRNRQERDHNWGISITEFDYVIDRAPRHFVMLPEILTKKGENLIRLGQGARGIREFLRAIELKPDYWPPYAYLSDYYKKIGELPKAREWLEKGLSTSPNTKALMQRLAELDGPKEMRKTAPGPARKPEATPTPE